MGPGRQVRLSPTDGPGTAYAPPGTLQEPNPNEGNGGRAKRTIQKEEKKGKSKTQGARRRARFFGDSLSTAPYTDEKGGSLRSTNLGLPLP